MEDIALIILFAVSLISMARIAVTIYDRGDDEYND